MNTRTRSRLALPLHGGNPGPAVRRREASQAATVLTIPNHAQGAAIGGGGLWIARSDWNWGTLDRLDPVTGAPQRRYEIAPKSRDPVTRNEVCTTLRWREVDSNHQFLVRRSRFLLRKANCGGSNGGGLLKLFLLRGTDGSNPSPSSSESANFQYLSVDRALECRILEPLAQQAQQIYRRDRTYPTGQQSCVLRVHERRSSRSTATGRSGHIIVGRGAG